MAGKHPGFQAVKEKIAAKEGVPEKAAGAILAKSTREASPAAKKKNPRLKRVKPPKNQPRSQAHAIMRQMMDEPMPRKRATMDDGEEE